MGETPVPPIVTTDAKSAGKSFDRRGARQNPSGDSRTIALVTVNGRTHNGPVYDANGNQII